MLETDKNPGGGRAILVPCRHDPASPSRNRRLKLLDDLLALFTRPERGSIEVVPEPLLYDAAIHLVEHIGHVVFRPEGVAETELRHRRKVILEALRAMLTPREND